MESRVVYTLVVVVSLLVVIADGLEKCRDEDICVNHCARVPLKKSTDIDRSVLCIIKGRPPSSSYPQFYIIEGCNGTYTNLTGNTSGICVRERDDGTVDLYINVNQLNSGAHDLNCLAKKTNDEENNQFFVSLSAIATFEGSGELDVVVVSTDVNGETSPVLPEDGVIPVQEGNRVDVTARAVGFSGVINSAMCTERTNCRRGFLCRSVNKTIVTPSSRFFRYSFNPIIQNDTSNITFTIDSFSKTVALNVTERPLPSSTPTTSSSTPTGATTTKTPEDKGTRSTGEILAIIFSILALLAIVSIVAIVALVMWCRKRNSPSTSTNFHDRGEKAGNGNFYLQPPVVKRQSKAMLYLCTNCMDLVDELKSNGIEIVDLPEDSSNFMDIKNELDSLLDKGIALISCDCPRDTKSNLRKLVQRITNLPSQAVETKRWNVFVIRQSDQATGEVLQGNKVVEVIDYSSTDDAVQQIRSRVVDDNRSSITERVIRQLNNIENKVDNVKEQAAEHHEEQKEDLEQLKETQNVLIKEAQ